MSVVFRFRLINSQSTQSELTALPERWPLTTITYLFFDRKMSGLFARLKKRDRRQPEPVKAPTASDPTTTDEAATSPKMGSPASSQTTPAEVEGPKVAVETDSIFKGLNLSAQATSTELGKADSPYLRRVQYGNGGSEDDKGESNEESSFSFLHDHQGDKGQESDSEKSNSDEPSGFGFINTTAKESEDDQQREIVKDEEPTPGERGEKMEQKDISTDSKHEAEVSSPLSSIKSGDLPSPPQPTIVKGEESSITGRSPMKVGGGRAAGRQVPPASGAVKKKKKRKAVIPGQERMATSSSQAEPESTSSSKSDLSSRVDDDMIAAHEESSEHSEQLIDIAAVSSEHGGEEIAPASSKHGGEEMVERCPNEEVTIKSTRDTATISHENVQSTSAPEGDVPSVATEDVDTTDTNSQKEPLAPEPVAVETAVEEAESRALEEVFGNYRIELSGEESYAALIESYQSSIKKIRDGTGGGEWEKSHTATMEHHLSSVEQLVSQRIDIRRLREEEENALKEENYEAAEQLNKKLEEMTVLSEWDIAERGLSTLKDWMSQCAEVSENERELRASMQTQLTQLKEEQSKSLQEINKQLALLKNKEKMRIQALQDKIDRDRGHIALDREHLERSEANLQEEVESRAAQPLAEKVKLEEKLSQVESEIEELEAKLTELRRERENLKEGIRAEEVTIAAVREELSAEQLQLDKEKKQIETRESEFKKEEEKLSRERHLMAATLLEEETKRDSLAKVIERAEAKCAELAGVNETLEELLSQLQPLVDKCMEKMKPSEQISRLHEQCDSCAMEVEKMSSEVLATQTKLTALAKKVSDDELHLQQLTDAKQAAVTGRQFKEASRLANESKTLSAKLDQERSEVTSTSSQLDELNKKLSDLSERLNSLRADTNAEEKKEDEDHIDRLSQWTEQLREKRESVKGTALEEVLEKWCQLHKLLTESLSTKHGLTIHHKDDSIHKETIITEERTPGVGMEGDGDGGREERSKLEERDGGREERSKLEERMAAIEADLDKACQEEDYDKAAELDEELQTVKKLLEH